MILKSIKLKNIRSYLDESVEFPVGSTLLSGDIGSGKSTILYAIEFALFGSRRKHLAGESLLRHGENSGEVELAFSVDGKEIVIKRVLKRSKDSVEQGAGYLVVNNVKTVATPVELKAKMHAFLGYPENQVTKTKDALFRYTVYTPQEAMKQILYAEKEHRLNILRSVFGIDKYKTVRENADIFTRYCKETIRVLQAKTEPIEEKKQLKKQLCEEYAGLVNQLAESKSVLDKQYSLVQEIKAKLAEIEKVVEELRKTQNKLDMADSKVKQLAAENSGVKQDIAAIEEQTADYQKKLDAFGDVKDPVEIIEKRLKEDEETFSILTQKQTSNKERLAACSTNITELESWLEQTSAKIKEAEAKKQSLAELTARLDKKEDARNKISEFEAELQKLNALVSNLEAHRLQSVQLKDKIQAMQQCPTCQQDVSQEHKHDIVSTETNKINECQAKIEQHNQAISGLRTTLDEKKQFYEELLRDEQEYTRLKTELEFIEKLSRELEGREQLAIKLRADKSKFERELADQKELLRMQESVKTNRQLLIRVKERDHVGQLIELNQKRKSKLENRASTIKQEISSLNQEKLELQQKIELIKPKQQEYSKLKQSYEEQQEKDKLAHASYATLNEKSEGLKQRIRTVEKELAGLEKLGERIHQYKQLGYWFESYFVKVSEVIEKHIFMKIYQEFNELFTTWFSMLLESESISARLDEDFTPVIEMNGYETVVENLSGGEKTACALAYRLALHKVVNDLMGRIKTRDLIILDEPTDGFSSQQLDKVRDVFEQLKITQIIIVSHESKIESFVENVLRVQKQDHISSVE